MGPGNAPKAPWAVPSSVSTDTMKVRSQRSSLLNGGRVIHRTFRKRSLCVNGSPALFPDRVALLGAIVGRKVRKARHFAVSAHRRSDPAKIDREAPQNGAFERFWGPKPGMYPKNVQCGRLYFRYILSDHADKRSLCKFIFSTAVKCDHKLFLRHPVTT